MCARALLLALLPLAASLSATPPGLRINKVFAAAFSRREADRLVAQGRVRLNGAVAEHGCTVRATDAVTVDGAPFETAGAFEGAMSEGVDGPHVYLKYWKPRGITCTTDRRVDGNIIDAVGHRGSRLFTVGRLDKDSEGLILLTNDGRLPNAICRAAHRHSKLYTVECSRPLSDAHLRQLARGVVITTAAQRDRGPAKVLTAPTLPCRVERRGPRAFAITLTEGRNRQIRRMCEALGFRVVHLHRDQVMGIDLGGLRRPGEWCELRPGELQVVQDALTTAEAASTARVKPPPAAPSRVQDARGRASIRGRGGARGAGGRGAGRGRGRGRGRASDVRGASRHPSRNVDQRRID
jgi:23S rRNA pseudouridine2604 synthase